MNKQLIFERIRRHHTAATIALFLLAITAIFAIPDGISLLDQSTSEPYSAVVNHEGNILNLIAWEYSTFIEKTNGIKAFDKVYGLPDLVILDPGNHLLTVNCVWRIFNLRWIKSSSTIQVQLEPGGVYKLVSSQVPVKGGIDTCSSETVKLDKYSVTEVTDMQNHYLAEYGLGLEAR